MRSEAYGVPVKVQVFYEDYASTRKLLDACASFCDTYGIKPHDIIGIKIDTGSYDGDDANYLTLTYRLTG